MISAICMMLMNSVNADTLRIGTWNIANLHHENNVPLRDRAAARDAEDFSRLKAIAGSLNLDIAFLQEIGSPAAIERLFPPDQYHSVISSRYQTGDESKPMAERDIFTAAVFSKATFPSIPATATLDALSIPHLDVWDGKPQDRPTRAGIVSEVKIAGEVVKVLGIHLK